MVVLQHMLWHCVGTQQEIIVAENLLCEYLTLVLECTTLKLRFVYITMLSFKVGFIVLPF